MHNMRGMGGTIWEGYDMTTYDNQDKQTNTCPNIYMLTFVVIVV